LFMLFLMNISSIDKIKVMHLTNNIGYASSVERLILMLAEKMDKSRFDLSIVSLTEPERVSQTFLESARALASNTDVIPWKRSKPFARSIIKLVSLIRKHNINILHTHEVRTNLVGLIAARLTGIKVVASVHGWVMDTVPYLWKIYQHFDRRVITLFDHIMVGSHFLRNEIIKLGMSSSRVTTIHNAIDTASLDVTSSPMNFRRKYNLNSGDMLIGTVGRISKEKGHKYFLEASKMVLKDFPVAKFLIVGEGELRSELEQFAEEIGIADNVIFTGYYKNLSEVLAAIDLFVIPSLTESLPLVVLEAMAAGKPVISTDVGGIPEVVIHGKTGLLVGPRKSVEMANSITLLLKNSEVMFDLAKNGRQLVYDEFSEKRFVGKTESLYSHLDCSKRSL